MLHITCKPVPVEYANWISLVERYHRDLHWAVTIIREECPNLDYDDELLAAVKSLNGSNGPDGLIPTLLIFGAIPRLGSRQDPPHPEIAKRTAALEKLSYFLVYRERGSTGTSESTGPYILLYKTYSTATVLAPSGPQFF